MISGQVIELLHCHFEAELSYIVIGLALVKNGLSPSIINFIIFVTTTLFSARRNSV